MPRAAKGAAKGAAKRPAKGAGTGVGRGKNTAGAKSPGRKAALLDIAEMLQSVAVASCTKHQRCAELVKRSAPRAEQRAALTEVLECDDILDEAVDLYELACLKETNHADDAWWHRANMVWRAAREYLQHHAGPRGSARFDAGHSRDDLRELNIEYELEASALLRLRHATDSYRAARQGTS